MKKLLLLISVVSMVAILALSVTGCSAKPIEQFTEPVNQTEDPKGEPEKQDTLDVKQAERVFVDLAGNEITLPEKLERVLITSMWPLPAVYCYYMGSPEGLIGIPEGAMSVARSSVFANMFPEILELETGFIDGTTVNIEEVLLMKPDIIFYTGERQEEYSLYENAGIPAVGFNTAMSVGGNVFNNIEQWLDQLAAIFGESARSESLIKFNNEVLEEVSTKVGAITEDKKPKAMIVFSHNESELRVAGSGHYSEFWLNSTGAINVAEEIEGIKVVDMEQVLAWNPDIVYLTTFSPVMPEDLLDNKIKGFDWSTVNAVKNQKVFKVPLGTYRWYAPSVEAPLMLKWMASINHSEVFGDTPIDKHFKDFFKEFYDYDLTEDDLEGLLRSSREAATTH